mgnify:CR=1 FL=1
MNSITDLLDSFKDLHQSEASFGVEGVLSIYSKCNFNADYQRGNVWTFDQKLGLIDSIIKRIDIGKIALIRKSDAEDWAEDCKIYEVLDGKQRMTAIWEFYNSEFQYWSKEFPNPIFYRQFDKTAKLKFGHRPLNFLIHDSLNRQQKLEYFLRLNERGLPVEKEHLDRVRELLLKELNINSKPMIT